MIYNNSVKYKILFNPEKEQILLATREIGFREVIASLNSNRFLADIENPSYKRKHQRIFVVEINNYAYAVPYVADKTKREIFLKTIYKSRVLTKKYLTRKLKRNEKS